MPITRKINLKKKYKKKKSDLQMIFGYLETNEILSWTGVRMYPFSRVGTLLIIYVKES